jgi:hypothetical protein
MKCEEFQSIGLDVGTGRISAAEESAAAEHAASCSRCAALAESWEAAHAELALFADLTRQAESPARVQMRLLQELRAHRRPHQLYRRTGIIAAWGLAAAAIIVAVGSWQNWRNNSIHPVVAKTIPAVTDISQSSPSVDTVLVADEDSGSFTPLPGALPLSSDDGAVYEVRMQRASLGALGLPVNEEGASDWISVDLLVADDGTPQGVRLHQDATQLLTAE